MDLISFDGPTFANWDNRVAALRLVQKELCDAALFDPSGDLPSLKVPALLHCHPLQGWEKAAGIKPPLAACPWHHQRNTSAGLIDAPYDDMRLCAGGLQIPQETLYKKNVLLMRGRFRPFTLLHNDMLQGACRAHASITLWNRSVEGIKHFICDAPNMKSHLFL